jgi:predicted glycogen debranching enzyme
MRFDAVFCRDLARSSRAEWLETNGIGGFASGTVSGVATRRYHALLIASLVPPTVRFASLASVAEVLRCSDGTTVELSANAYVGAIHPHGYEYLESFEPYPFPTWTYRLPDGSRIEKTVAMVNGKNTTVVRYVLLDGAGGPFGVRPHLVWRDYHALQGSDDLFTRGVTIHLDRVLYQPTADRPALAIRHTFRDVRVEAWWVYRKRYAIEADERGLDHLEDHWSPCELQTTLTPSSPSASLIATVEPDVNEDASTCLARERQRRETIWASCAVAPDVGEPVANALHEWNARAEDFLVRRGDRKWTVIAGYPWFTDWGRDTMIALPGLTLARGLTERARELIASFASFCDQGMIPNRFPDDGDTPLYNTVDATLWFVEAIRRYAAMVPDDPIIRDAWYPLLCSILDAHRGGTRYGIHVDTDGLLHAGQPGTQLTWMDAKLGDWVVTPRIGKPVEINALWYNALRTVEALASRFDDAPRAMRCATDATRTREAFCARFPNPLSGGLFDVIDTPDGDDPTIRPNQIIAVSLVYRMLDNETERRVVELVDAMLYTPFGLWSLAPNHPGYAATYEGDASARDAVYHQGPVWGWLWGPFVTAYGNAFGRGASFRVRVLEWLRLLATRRDTPGIGGIAELYDGRVPHRARGCPWQAWSLAEVLRVAHEERILMSPSTLEPETTR